MIITGFNTPQNKFMRNAFGNINEKCVKAETNKGTPTPPFCASEEPNSMETGSV